ncbi:MAG: putative nucleotidyltransferase [Candidatus Omnitrophota bacterium]|jgi:predicted nucleotidyltransferase
MTAGKENQYVNEIRDEVLLALEKQPVRVFLFGSRARSDHNRTSDVDIGLMPRSGFDMHCITQLKYKLETINTPYKVEVVNFDEVSEDFKREALKDIVLWKD